MQLLDAMPLILAFELGYFSDEGLKVELEQQIGWGNVRDKLVYGHLDASHALFGMPPLSVLQADRYTDPLVSIMALGTGGDAITLSRRWTDAGVDSAAALARRLKPRPVRVPTLAHVFGCSVHHYLLRGWLASAGLDPDRDVNLIVLPPMQMARQMSVGTVDGFCAGEPWNTMAEADRQGRVVLATTELMPAHPDKVLAVSRRWLDDNTAAATALVRATLRACDFCDQKQNRSRIAGILSRPEYLAMPDSIILDSLEANRLRRPAGVVSPATRSCATSSTFPAVAHCQWLLGEMIRWGHLPSGTDVKATAREAVDTAAYRVAAADLKLACPSDDAPVLKPKPSQPARSGDPHAVLA